MITSKQLRSRSSQQVLQERASKSRRGDVVTYSGRSEARKRYQKLRPWLELANIVAPILDGQVAESAEMMVPVLKFVDRARNSESFPAEQLRQWVKQSSDKAEANRQVFRLALDVARAFLFCTGDDPEGGFAFEEGPRLGSRLVRGGDGLINVEIFEPYRDDFLPVIRGIEIERIRRCPVCSNIFFALRHKAGSVFGSKACSRECNQVRRVREWRAKQAVYEQNRKFVVAGVQPKRKRS